MANIEGESPGESILRRGIIISSNPGLDIVELPGERRATDSSSDFDGELIFDSTDPDIYLGSRETQAKRIWVHSFPSWSLMKPQAEIIDFTSRITTDNEGVAVQAEDPQANTQAA